MQIISINSNKIGEGHPTYVIAEIGINHNGSEAMAYKLIDAAVEAKADAVKFQKRDLVSIYQQEVLDHPERFEQYFQYMIPLLKRVELSQKCIERLKSYCQEQRITFLCTPFDKISASLLDDMDVAAFKIASADLTNSPLLHHVARFNKPIILSTGMSSWKEIDTAVKILRERDAQFALLHCRSVYPVWPREVNLRMLGRLKNFDVPVGYSGHELGITIGLVAASMGANIIEKHITLDRTLDGPDHKVSLEPYEFKRLVRDIRIADQAIGKEKRFLLRGEVLNRELFGKSLLANQEIPKGTTVTLEMIEVKGPGKGLAPDRMEQLVGTVATRDIAAGTFFLEKDIVSPPKYNFNKDFKSDWGLIARFTDCERMLSYNPRVLEFHLAEKDFNIPFLAHTKQKCRLVVHAPEYLGERLMDLCSGNEQIRRDSVELVCETIRLTNSLAPFFAMTPKVIAHPGAMSFQGKLNGHRLSLALKRSLQEIRESDGASQIELLFENLPPYPWYFGGQWKGNYFMAGEEIASFCAGNDVRICFDLSHAALYCNAKGQDLSELIKTLLPYTSHLHLADGYGLDGEGVQFGDGDIDLDTIMPLFNDFKGTWVPEVWRGHLDNGRGFLNALEYLGKWLP